MSFIDAFKHRLRALLRPTEHERELADEVAHHLALDEAQYRDADARARARRRFGNVTSVKEATREAAGLTVLDVIAQDARFALRMLRRTPGFTAVTVAVLAVGIGANTALFSAVDAILLKPLPFDQPDRLMKLNLTTPPRGDEPARDDRLWSFPKFATFRDAQKVFRDLAVYSEAQATILAADQADRIPGEIVGARYFPILGIRPILGRTFGPDEDAQPDGPRVVLLSDGVWRRVFGTDSTILGRTITLNAGVDPRTARQFTVVGILPPSFRGLSGRAEYWLPVMSEPGTRMTNPRAGIFDVIGRLKDGVSVAQATTVVHELGAVVDRTYPDQNFATVRWGAVARELDATRADPLVRRSLFILLGAAGLVLLIACVNVANLLLLRAAGRRREIAARLALGASRGRVVRQLLTESVMLSVLGGAASLVIAWWGTRILATLEPTNALGVRQVSGLGAVGFQAISFDASAFAFAVVLTIVTGIAFGFAPALHATRSSLAHAMTAGDAPQPGRSASVFTGRHVLAIVEITLAIVLLVGAGLMLESLAKRLRIDPGFAADRVLTFRFTTGNRSARDSVAGFYEQVIDRVAALPGVESVGLANCVPLAAATCSSTMVVPRDRPDVSGGMTQEADVHWVTPGWFRAMRTSLRRGRMFSSGDRQESQKVVLVNETAARTYWPGQDPIGRPVSVGTGFQMTDTAYVIGIVADVRYGKVELPPHPAVYVSYMQSPIRGVMLFVRTAVDPLAMAPAIRRAMRQLAPESPVFDVRTMESRVAAAMAQVRFSTILLVLFGAVALILATVGTYGVISFGVAQRTREIGIRMALGATREEIVRKVIGQGLALALIGAAFGSAGAFATTGVLRSFLYEVTPADPATFTAIAVLLTTVVVIASWLPARRAARVDPTIALRQ